ncbi:hypothetical protein SPBR_04434 [Sporothrix brasiliensis 5110]|uniref:Aldehyde dehydrogenase domain-containing protein n=1 Tax=Sporothrix brasiliensis 5110 TaxID=1398154 RepID=A0A0C2F3Q9_9PEZI|nr:uncharacterized protein SPBR_04434 [Sporothrix brasiliensis 5110]KIH93554.1 hypothetical protein SPBR_04434 [Sporothrix brasiliensis 5110]
MVSADGRCCQTFGARGSEPTFLNDAFLFIEKGHMDGACVTAHGTTASFVQPTVLTDVMSDMRIALEETFGPVAGVFRFMTEAEVLDLANGTEFGQAAYVFSRDVHRARRVARPLDAGIAGLNTRVISDAAALFGGVKSSGFGQEGSKYGIEEYMMVKTIILGAKRVQRRL